MRSPELGKLIFIDLKLQQTHKVSTNPSKDKLTTQIQTGTTSRGAANAIDKQWQCWFWLEKRSELIKRLSSINLALPFGDPRQPLHSTPATITSDHKPIKASLDWPIASLSLRHVCPGFTLASTTGSSVYTVGHREWQR
jgi:hypothetical protein